LETRPTICAVETVFSEPLRCGDLGGGGYTDALTDGKDLGSGIRKFTWATGLAVTQDGGHTHKKNSMV
jgi:hypothetical protein